MKTKRVMWLVCLLLLISSGMVRAERPASFQDDYRLKEMVILSRHNIRSPLSGNGSVLQDLTSHTWFRWTSAPSELSLRGGQLETMMGQYFRQRLVADNLMTENYLPKEGEVRFYANSM